MYFDQQGRLSLSGNIVTLMIKIPLFHIDLSRNCNPELSIFLYSIGKETRDESRRGLHCGLQALSWNGYLVP